jgi:small subunit ribosomal protein S3Ae
MVAVKKRKTAEAWKKKEWYSIRAPKLLDEKEVGTTPADEPAKLMNRVISVPLRDITGDVSQQFVKLLLRVNDVKGKTAYTKLDGFELVRDSLRRNIRRRRSLIRTVLPLESKDGVKMQVTAYTFAGMKIDTSKKDDIRKLMNEMLIQTAKETPLDTLIQKLIFGGAATAIFKSAKKIAVIKRVEIAKCMLLRSS